MFQIILFSQSFCKYTGLSKFYAFMYDTEKGDVMA